MKTIVVTILLSMAKFGFSQPNVSQSPSEKTEPQTIYLEEKIPTNVLSNMHTDNLVVAVLNAQNVQVANLSLATMQDFQFKVPGEYTVKLTGQSNAVNDNKKHNCDHKNHDKTLTVNVLPYRLDFKLDQIIFSNNIVGGVDTKGSTLKVPVELKSFSNTSLEIPQLKLVSAGVNTTIEGVLSEEKSTLTPGLNYLTYELKGSASKDTYIMFDFFDLSGRAVSYSYPSIIK